MDDATIGQLLGLNLGWTYNYIFGLLILLFFARDQLNRPVAADEAEKHQARLIQKLAPDQMRNSKAFVQGYLFYTAVLVSGYTVISLIGAPALKFTLSDESGLDATGASAPLLAALAIVGLMPNSPLLATAERRVRQFTHRMLGIPHNLFRTSSALFDVELDERALRIAALGRTDNARFERIVADVRRVYGAGPQSDRHVQSILKLFLFRAWEATPSTWPSWSVRNGFRQIEIDIAPVVDAVIDDLEDLSERMQTRPVDEDAAAEAMERMADASRWEALLARVETSAMDVCALLALYAERAEARPESEDAVSRLLALMLDRAEARTRTRTPHLDILARSLLVMMPVMFVMGYVGHLTDIIPYPGFTPAAAATAWAIGVVANYGPSAFTSWSARRAAVARRTWESAFDDDHVFPTLQYVGVFFQCWLASAVSMSAFLLFMQMYGHLAAVNAGVVDLRIDLVFEQFVAFSTGGAAGPMWQALAFALLGGCHGVVMALMMDHDQRVRLTADDPAKAGENARRGLALAAAQPVGLVLCLLLATVATGRLQSALHADGVTREALRAVAAFERAESEIIARRAPAAPDPKDLPVQFVMQGPDPEEEAEGPPAPYRLTVKPTPAMERTWLEERPDDAEMRALLTNIQELSDGVREHMALIGRSDIAGPVAARATTIYAARVIGEESHHYRLPAAAKLTAVNSVSVGAARGALARELRVQAVGYRPRAWWAMAYEALSAALFGLIASALTLGGLRRLRGADPAPTAPE